MAHATVEKRTEDYDDALGLYLARGASRFEAETKAARAIRPYEVLVGDYNAMVDNGIDLAVLLLVGGAGTAFILYGPTNGSVAEFNTTLRAKRLATGGATASVVVSQGDYLVIEIGTTTTVAGTSLSDSISYGDNSATDLGDNETDTAANNPFVEIAATITLLALSGSESGAGADTSSAPAVALSSIDSGAGVETSAVTSVTTVSTDGGIGTDSGASPHR